MKTLRFVLPGLALLTILPAAGAAPAPKASPIPSVQLRQMIDKTLPKISVISNMRQAPFDRTALTMAQADFQAKAITAPPAQQPMFQAAQNVVANLIGAVEEHEKAMADYRYSKGVHGKQDRENAVISQPQRGWDAGAVARADAAKQKMENADSRKAELDKEKFMNSGTVNSWTERVGQLHDVIEQSFTAELVAEKQLAMLTPAPPPPLPAPKPAPSLSAAQQYSPLGTWQASNPSNRSATLNEDYTVSGGKWGGKWNLTGTWKWTDQSHGALAITWADGLTSNVLFSRDGSAMAGKASNGHDVAFSRSTSPPPNASTSPPPPAPSVANAATSPLPPAPKPASKPNPPAASGPGSPVGAWSNPKGETWTLNADGTFTNQVGAKGTWHWADATQHIMLMTWPDGGTGSAAFSADGKTLQVTKPKGQVKLTR